MRRHTAAFAGVGHSQVLRHDDVPLGLLAVEACQAAITDAGLRPDQIDGVVCAPNQPFDSAGASYDGRDFVSAELVARTLRIQARWGENVDRMVSHSVVEAIDAVESGRTDYVLVFRALHSPQGKYGHTAAGAAREVSQFSAPYGAFNATGYAQMWQRYRHKYKSGSREQMSTLVCQARANGLRYDYSYWRLHKPELLTTEEYLGARMVSDPLSMLDCDLPVQGCGAFVITTRERAADLPHPSAYVRGVSAPLPPKGLYLPRMRLLEAEQAAAHQVAAELWRDSGLGPGDVDVANLYDGFSFLAILWIEALGLCGEGEAFDYIQGGVIAPGSRLPLNTSGGSLGAGRMHGVPHILESVLQVTDRAGERQVPGAEVALATVGYPSRSAALIVSRAAP